MIPSDDNANVVAAVTDHERDKYALLEEILDRGGFFEALKERWQDSGKDQSEFRVVVKPNLSMMLRRSDVGTYTDPFLVIHLLRLLLARGFTKLAVVESQNLYGNWFDNREVAPVARRAGLFGTEADDGATEFRVRGGGVDGRARLVDLTDDAIEHDFGGEVGSFEVGRAWAEADFRINFAKMKSHFYACYTLAIKNLYGCLPEQDKVRGYHCKRVVGSWTAHMTKAFPPHFSIVDGFSAADGWIGVKMKAICRKPHTLLAGREVLAVDHFGAGLFGIKPERSVMYAQLARLTPPAPYRVVGAATSPRPWNKAPFALALASKVIEGNANVMDFAGSLATGGHDECFPKKRTYQGLAKKFLYYLTLPVNLMCDVGFLQLRTRERAFVKRIKARADQTPVIADSEFLLSRLTFMSGDDLEALASMLDLGAPEQIDFCGHYLLLNGREIPFPTRLTTTNLAAVELLTHVREQALDAPALAAELRSLGKLHPRFFGEGMKYSYCYA